MIWLKAVGLYLTITGFVCMGLSYLFVERNFHLTANPRPFQWQRIKAQYRSPAGWRLLLAGMILVALGPLAMLISSWAK